MPKKKRKFNLQKKIIESLRTLSVYWPPKKEARKEAEVRVKVGKFKNGNDKFIIKYRCNSCEGLFDREETHMDHKEPVVDPNIGFVDYNTFVARLFVEKDKYQLLCESCHQIKSTLENEVRKENRKKVDKRR